MKAISIVVLVALIAFGAMAAVKSCTGLQDCTNCTESVKVGPGTCHTESGVSYKYTCSGGNVTISGFATSDCSGTAATFTLKEGCNAGTGISVTCGAAMTTVLMAVAAIVAMML